MMQHISNNGTAFGGSWTVEKLEILEKYLDAYTTALKNQSFKLIYIDAFAGGGAINLHEDNNAEATDATEARRFIMGSVERALKINNKPFDKLIFVEKDPSMCSRLKKLRTKNPCRNIEIENGEAKEFLSNLDVNWNRWRGVLFLDPFGATVEWSTIEKIARINALDTWILFPVSAIARMLPTSMRPEKISEAWVTRLTKVYGAESWKKLYEQSRQQDLFGKVEWQRNPGIEGLQDIYRAKLSALFGERFLTDSRELRNSKNSVLYEFLFCVGNPKGICPAKRIAGHLLNYL